MNPTRIRITPRQLVHRHIGAVRLSPISVATALLLASRKGYVANYIPPPSAFDQHLVLLPVNSPFAALYRTLTDDGAATPLPRGLIESRIQIPLENIFAGMMLARLGLAIVGLEERCVLLRGTTTDLAYQVNFCRYSGDRPPVPSWMMVVYATGMIIPPARITSDIRERAAAIYTEFRVTVDGLLAGEAKCKLVSHWQFMPPMPRRAAPDDMLPPF